MGRIWAATNTFNHGDEIGVSGHPTQGQSSGLTLGSNSSGGGP